MAGTESTVPSSILVEVGLSASGGSSGGGVRSTDMFLALAYGCVEGTIRGRANPALVPRTVVAARVNNICCARLGAEDEPPENDADRVISAAFPTTRNSLASFRNGDATDPSDHIGLNAFGVSGKV